MAQTANPPVSNKEQPAALRGRAADGKVELPPLSQPSEAEGQTPNPMPPGRRLGIAVVGLGHLTLQQIMPGFMLAKNVRVTALVSGDREKARTVAAQSS